MNMTYDNDQQLYCKQEVLHENVARFCSTVGTSWYLYENEIRQLECLLTALTNTSIRLMKNPYSP